MNPNNSCVGGGRAASRTKQDFALQSVACPRNHSGVRHITLACDPVQYGDPPRRWTTVRSVYTCFGRAASKVSEKDLQFSDMNNDSPDLKTAMLDRIRADAPRRAWTPSDFVDLASRDAVDKALQRLADHFDCGTRATTASDRSDPTPERAPADKSRDTREANYRPGGGRPVYFWHTPASQLAWS